MTKVPVMHNSIFSESTKKVSLGQFTQTKPNLMERFIGTDTARFELFFNIFTSGTETFVMPWDHSIRTYNEDTVGTFDLVAPEIACMSSKNGYNSERI